MSTRVAGWIALGVVASGCLLAGVAWCLGAADPLRWLEVAAILGTGAIVWAYTAETTHLRAAAERQVEATTTAARLAHSPVLRPLLSADGTLRIQNLGDGIAVAVSVALPEVDLAAWDCGEGIGVFRCSELTMIAPRSRRLLGRIVLSHKDPQQAVSRAVSLHDLRRGLGPGTRLGIRVTCQDRFGNPHQFSYYWNRDERGAYMLPIAAEDWSHPIEAPQRLVFTSPP